MTPALVDELVATAANLASLLIMLPPAEAAETLRGASAHIATTMAEAFGDEIGREIASAFSKAVRD